MNAVFWTLAAIALIAVCVIAFHRWRGIAVKETIEVRNPDGSTTTTVTVFHGDTAVSQTSWTTGTEGATASLRDVKRKG